MFKKLLEKLGKLNQRQRNDRGLSLIEMAFVIIVVSIVIGGVVVVALRVLSGGQDSVAKGNLRTARIAAEGLYNSVTDGGTQSFCGAQTRNKATAGDDTPTGCSDAYVAELLNASGEQLVFCTYGEALTDAPTASTGTPTEQCDRDIQNWDNRTIWVDVLELHNTNTENEKIHATDIRIRPGKLLRIGARSESGATYCMVIVKDSSDVTVVGTGFQSVNEDDSNTDPDASATGADTGWADCGAEYHRAMTNDATTKTKVANSLPNGSLVDEQFFDPKDSDDYDA